MQVFISYGKRSSGELLLAYGFIPPELNPHDFVELELALNEEDPLYDAKLAALREQGLSSYPWCTPTDYCSFTVLDFLDESIQCNDEYLAPVNIYCELQGLFCIIDHSGMLLYGNI